jgi:hypothetical protein
MTLDQPAHATYIAIVDRTTPRALNIALVILALFAFGAPIMAYLWGTLNSLMAGHPQWTRLWISIPVFLLFLLLLRLTTWVVNRTAGQPES